MRQNIIRLLIVVLCCVNFSCTKWLTIQPKTKLTSDQMFETVGGFNDALIGVYTDFQEAYDINSNNRSKFIEHLACQWDGVRAESKDERMNLHIYDDLESEMGTIFKAHYRNIANVNIILDNIDNGVLKNIDDYNRIKGESLALRVFFHFDLIRMWGPMPDEVNANKAYLPYVKTIQITPYQYLKYSEFMNILLEDLATARELLSKVPAPTIINFEKSRYYFSYNSTVALAARIYLWLNDNESAYKSANEIIEFAKKESLYTLATERNIDNRDFVFKSEHILCIPFKSESATNLSALFRFKTNLEETLFQTTKNDIRLNQWIERVSSDVDKSVSPCKYNSSEVPNTPDTNTKTNVIFLPIIRLAELYLIAMEATTDLDKANQLYKEFCVARNIDFLAFENQSDKMEKLLFEYRKEFIAEGQLFYAYKRLAISSMPRCSRICGSESYVLPIPRKEIDVNY